MAADEVDGGAPATDDGAAHDAAAGAAEHDEDAGSGDDTVLECAACSKRFKTEGQWVSHERSKKHKRAVQALRLRLLEEEAMLGEMEELGLAAEE